ncbi:MAG: hypothetical protein EHM46_04680, partial [Bacteroidetes bacterium]
MTDVLLVILVLLSIVILLMILFSGKKDRGEEAVRSIGDSLKRLEVIFEQQGKSLKDDFQRGRGEDQANFARNRMELSKNLENFQGRLEKMRETIEVKLKDIQVDNNNRLEEMR